MFVHESLRRDGITILRLLSDNAGDVVAAGIVKRLWMMWRTNPMGKGNNSNNNIPLSAQALPSPSVDSLRSPIGPPGQLWTDGYHEPSPDTSIEKPPFTSNSFN
jgi:hypothetical protein